jgi:hypothetical protein
MTLTAPTTPNFAGEVVNPGSADYDSARTLFNGLIDKRPIVLLRCRFSWLNYWKSLLVTELSGEAIRASFGQDTYRRLIPDSA